MSQHNLCPAGNRSQAPTTPTNKTCFSLQLPITAQGHNQRTTSHCPPHTPRGIVTSCPSIMAFSLQCAELGSIMLQLLGYHYLAVPHEDHSVHPYILRHTAVSGEKKHILGSSSPSLPYGHPKPQQLAFIPMGDGHRSKEHERPWQVPHPRRAPVVLRHSCAPGAAPALRSQQ